jgi:glyoxylase-like metal-dependent hydrolase (beta-lactamase superfamily II)/ferredoxin
MANPNKCFADNLPGEFFVDTTCIDCDTCRQLAPAVFGEAGDHAFVQKQPSNSNERRAALWALLSCPTGSIGTVGRNGAKQVIGDFPLPVEAPVYYCGFNSPKSFGGNGYFIKHPHGNWLVDSPKYLPQLVRRFEELGGIAYIFLTHRDDVADASRYAKRFGSRRIIHQKELASQPDAEQIIDAEEPVEIAPDFVVIPTPGHTAGHCVLNYKRRFLFTGDHLWWDRNRRRLDASRDYCWYSWSMQTESMRRLADHQFEWVLPGHGQRVHLTAVDMHRQVHQLVERMQEQTS